MTSTGDIYMYLCAAGIVYVELEEKDYLLSKFYMSICYDVANVFSNGIDICLRQLLQYLVGEVEVEKIL